jgi:hypothetical protein
VPGARQTYAGNAWGFGASTVLGSCWSTGCACVSPNRLSLAVNGADSGMVNQLVNNQSSAFYSIGCVLLASGAPAVPHRAEPEADQSRQHVAVGSSCLPILALCRACRNHGELPRHLVLVPFCEAC